MSMKLRELRFAQTVVLIVTEFELPDEHGLRFRLELPPDGDLVLRSCRLPLTEGAMVLFKAGVNPRATLRLVSSISMASYGTNHCALRGVLHEIVGDPSLPAKWDATFGRFKPSPPTR
jgi:hypothetical protein